MPFPNEHTVEALCAAILTITARLTRIVVDSPDTNIDALRDGLLQIWNILPAEKVTVH